MARNIKGFKHIERVRDSFEEYKAIKLYKGIYKEEDLKIYNMVNQFGQWYTDIYLREGAIPKAEINAMFGSYMNFKDKETGKITGDTVLIKEE